MTSLYIALAIIIFLVIGGIIVNNLIIVKNNRIEQAFGSIDAYLKQRFDLLPNLITVLKKYMKYEKGLLIQVTELRVNTQKTTIPSERVDLSNQLNKFITNINVENYPEVKADKQFAHVMYTLNEIEEQLSASRRAYNAAIIDYNNIIQTFPTNIIATIRGDKQGQVLEASVIERKNIDVNKLFERL